MKKLTTMFKGLNPEHDLSGLEPYDMNKGFFRKILFAPNKKTARLHVKHPIRGFFTGAFMANVALGGINVIFGNAADNATIEDGTRRLMLIAHGAHAGMWLDALQYLARSRLQYRKEKMNSQPSEVEPVPENRL